MSDDEERQPLLKSDQRYGNGVNSVKYEKVNDEAAVLDKQTESENFSFCRLPRRKKIIFLVIGSVNFCACTCFSLLAPFFPDEAKKKGASQTIVGLIFSCFEFWVFLTSPIFGYFLAKIGAKFMFVSGVMVCGCCSILFGTLDKSPPGDTFIVMCFLSRTVEALGCSAFITASFAIIAYEFPNNVATVFGTLETFSGIGLMVGPPIGGALYTLGGYGLPFWTLGAVLITCGLVALVNMPGEDEPRQPFKGSVTKLLRSPLVIVTGLTIFGGSFSLGFMDPTLANHLHDFHLSPFYVGLIFLCAPGVYGFTAPIWGYISDAKNWTEWMMIIGLLFSTVALGLLGPSPFLTFVPFELWIIIISLCMLGLFVGCLLIPTFKCLLIGAKQLGFEESLDTYGMVSGLFNSAFSLGAFTGPSFGGFLQDKYGFDWASTACAAIYLLVFFVLVIFKLVSKQGFREPVTSSSSSSSSSQ